MKFMAMVLCRLDSKRFPRKVLYEISGKPLIWYPVNKCMQINNIETVIATTDRKIDDPIAGWAEKNGLIVFRGATDDVAKRIVDCLYYYNIDYFYRVNADSPFLEIGLLNQAYNLINESRYHFVTNIFPRSFPYGVSVECFDAGIFIDGYHRMSDSEQKEHSTMFFYQNADRYYYHNICIKEKKLGHYKLAIDTRNDLKRLSPVIEKLYNINWLDSSYKDAIKLLEE